MSRFSNGIGLVNSLRADRTSSVEKCRTPPSTRPCTGICIFNRDILIKRLGRDAATRDSPHDFGYSVFLGMVNHDRAFAHEFTRYWQGIGTPEAYYQANMELPAARSRYSLDSNCAVASDRGARPVPKSSRDGRVVNRLISPGVPRLAYFRHILLLLCMTQRCQQCHDGLGRS
jgi:ADP-glucose pyrophosphorylase